MTQVQSGILLEHCRFGIFLEAIVQGEFSDLRQGCKQFCEKLGELQQQFPDAGLGAVIAFGADVWHDLSDGQGAKELKPFTPLGKGLAPATQRDMLIHIQSLRHDVNFSLAQAALTTFGNAIRIEEETHGFRWVEERDLSGFIDGTENPQGEQRPVVAVIGEGEEDAGEAMCWYSVTSITCANGNASPPNNRNKLLAVPSMTAKNCHLNNGQIPRMSAGSI